MSNREDHDSTEETHEIPYSYRLDIRPLQSSGTASGWTMARLCEEVVQDTNSWSAFLKPADLLTYTCSAGHNVWAFAPLTKNMEVGEKLRAPPWDICRLTPSPSAPGPGLGCIQTSASPGANCKQVGRVDNADKSLTHFAVVRAKSNTDLSEIDIISTASRGSNGCWERTSNTTNRSHRGTRGLETGSSRRAPFMKRPTQRCCPTGFSPQPKWQAEIASK